MRDSRGYWQQNTLAFTPEIIFELALQPLDTFDLQEYESSTEMRVVYL